MGSMFVATFWNLRQLTRAETVGQKLSWHIESTLKSNLASNCKADLLCFWRLLIHRLNQDEENRVQNSAE